MCYLCRKFNVEIFTIINYQKKKKKILLQDLKNRLNNLEDARSKVSLDEDTMKELINGTPYRPRLNLLLEWAVEAFNYYHELYPLIANFSQIWVVNFLVIFA